MGKTAVSTPETTNKKGKAKTRYVGRKACRAKHLNTTRPLKKLRNMLRNCSLNAAGKWAVANNSLAVLKQLAKKENIVGHRAYHALAILDAK